MPLGDFLGVHFFMGVGVKLRASFFLRGLGGGVYTIGSAEDCGGFPSYLRRLVLPRRVVPRLPEVAVSSLTADILQATASAGFDEGGGKGGVSAFFSELIRKEAVSLGEFSGGSADLVSVASVGFTGGGEFVGRRPTAEAVIGGGQPHGGA